MKRKTWAEVRNRIINGDCLEEMALLPRGIITAVITSPPYNLRNSTGNGMKWNRGSGQWKRATLQHGYGAYKDDMPRAEYISWQRDCIAAMLDLLPEDGVIFYNHKNRVQAGLLQDCDAIMAGFPVRQIIVWDRLGGANHNPGYLLPSYELIYMIAKPKFVLPAAAMALTDVWRIRPDLHNPHPAPFPLEVARRAIIASGAQAVMDPFMGSGTTALAATSLGVDYVGIEQDPRYCADAERRARHGVIGPRNQGVMNFWEERDVKSASLEMET